MDMETNLKKAWDFLWTSGGSDYLPTIIASGKTQTNGIIPALESIAIDPVGPIALFKEDSSGYVSVSFEEMELQGFSSLSGKTIIINEKTGTVQMRCVIGHLQISGNYVILSGVLTGCSIASAKTTIRALATGSGEDPNITLAKQYLAQLNQASNPNGNVLVNMFYDQNETLNSIVLAQNAIVNGYTNQLNGKFRDAWLNYQTNNQSTLYYMGITSTAAANPSNSDSGFNDENYNKHGAYMETVLTVEAVSLKNLKDPRGESLYEAIVGNAINNAQPLEQQASSFTGNTVSALMQYVQSGGNNAVQADAALTGAVQKRKSTWEEVRAQAIRDCEQWVSDQRHLEYAPGANRFSSLSEKKLLTHTFKQSLAPVAIVLTATVSQENGEPRIIITNIEASISPPVIELPAADTSPLNNKVQQAISQAAFIGRLMQARVQVGLNSEYLRLYLSGRFNEAIQTTSGK